MKEKFLVIIPHEFVPEENSDLEVGDLSMYQVEDVLENLEDRLASMVRAGLFESFIILPFSDLEELDDISELEMAVLQYRMQELQR